MAAIVFAVMRQGVDTVNLKIGFIQAIGLVTEILSHTRATHEHRIDDVFARVVKGLVLELHQNDRNLALTQGRNARICIAAAHPGWSLLLQVGSWFRIKSEIRPLSIDECCLDRSALTGLMGSHRGHTRQ